jgi:hypothetical protein
MASPDDIAQLPRMKAGCRGALSQLIDMERILAKDALNPTTKPSARAQVARAWEVLEERKRILRMKPKPKDVDVDPQNHQKRMRTVPAQILNAADEDRAAESKPPNGS